MRKINFTPVPFNFWNITGVMFVGNHHEIHRVGDPQDYATLAALNDAAMEYGQNMIPDDVSNGIERVEVRYMMQAGSVPVYEIDIQRYLERYVREVSIDPIGRISNADMCPNEAYKKAYMRGQS